MEKQDLGKLKGFDTYADKEDEVFDWVVYLKENGIAISNITADREDKNIKSEEIAFNFHPDYWQKGYMSEAIIKVLAFLFEFGFENVMCGYSDGNVNSKKIGDKLGFELFSTIPNAWKKDGASITDYKTIMSKDKFKELYIQKKR